MPVNSPQGSLWHHRALLHRQGTISSEFHIQTDGVRLWYISYRRHTPFLLLLGQKAKCNYVWRPVIFYKQALPALEFQSSLAFSGGVSPHYHPLPPDICPELCLSTQAPARKGLLTQKRAFWKKFDFFNDLGSNCAKNETLGGII